MCKSTHRESVEQVGEHLSSHRALSPAHEGAQSISEDCGDPIHIHVPHELQLQKQTHTMRENIRDVFYVL